MVDAHTTLVENTAKGVRRLMSDRCDDCDNPAVHGPFCESCWATIHKLPLHAEALRVACHMSEETGEVEDPEKENEAAFFMASAHGDDKTRESYQKWYDSPAEKRKRRER